MKYYWAYGSNLNVIAMQRRCPGAKPVRKLSLPNGALVFRGVADVVYRKDHTVHGGLWLITEENEQELDRYEGVKSGLYRKLYLSLQIIPGLEAQCLYYKMNRKGIAPPSQSYLDCIAEGYRDFGLPIEDLSKAVDHSYGNKKLTPEIKAHRQRRGGAPARSLEGRAYGE